MTRFNTANGSADGLSAIFHDHQIMRFGKLHDRRHWSHQAIEMNGDDDPCSRGDEGLNGFFSKGQGAGINVGPYQFRAGPSKGDGCRAKRMSRQNNFIPRPQPAQKSRNFQSGCAARNGEGMTAAVPVREFLFKLYLKLSLCKRVCRSHHVRDEPYLVRRIIVATSAKIYFECAHALPISSKQNLFSHPKIELVIDIHILFATNNRVNGVLPDRATRTDKVGADNINISVVVEKAFNVLATQRRGSIFSKFAYKACG